MKHLINIFDLNSRKLTGCSVHVCQQYINSVWRTRSCDIIVNIMLIYFIDVRFQCELLWFHEKISTFFRQKKRGFIIASGIAIQCASRINSRNLHVIRPQGDVDSGEKWFVWFLGLSWLEPRTTFEMFKVMFGVQLTMSTVMSEYREKWLLTVNRPVNRWNYGQTYMTMGWIFLQTSLLVAVVLVEVEEFLVENGSFSKGSTSVGKLSGENRNL